MTPIAALRSQPWLTHLKAGIRRQWKRAAICFMGIMGLVVAGLLFATLKYESETRLFVRVGRESIALDPTATTGQTVNMLESRESEINSLVDLLNSRQLLETVVDRLGTQPILELPGQSVLQKLVGQQPERSYAELKSSSRTPHATSLKREKAIRKLAGRIGVSNRKNSNMITVVCEGKSPSQAQGLLQELLDAFQDHHLQMHRTDGSHQFFEEQTRQVRQQFQDASRQLEDAKNQIDAVSVEQRRASLQQQIETIETTLMADEAELASVQERASRLEEILSALPKKQLSEEVSGFPNDAEGQTRRQLHELLIREQQLLADFTPQHPEVRSLRQQIEAAEAILGQRGPKPNQATNANNPTYQELQVQMLTSGAEAAALRKKLSSLRTQRAELRGRLQALNAQEATIVRLQKDVDLLGTKYDEYSERLEQARIDQALQRERISNINVVQPPTFVPKPASPRKLLVLIAGFLLAATAAVLLALISEFSRGSFDSLFLSIPTSRAAAVEPVFRSEAVRDALARPSETVYTTQG